MDCGRVCTRRLACDRIAAFVATVKTTRKTGEKHAKIMNIKGIAIWNSEHRPMEAYYLRGKSLHNKLHSWLGIVFLLFYVTPYAPTDASSERFPRHRYDKGDLLEGIPKAFVLRDVQTSCEIGKIEIT